MVPTCPVDMKTDIPPPSAIPKAYLKRISSFLPGQEPVLAGKHTIRVCEPNLSSVEKTHLLHAFDSSWLSSSGAYVERFERAFAHTVSQTKYAFAVNSGTTALHLALAALGIGPGDEVILPAFTMIATINAVSYCGATPRLVDSNPITWNMDTNAVAKAITRKTKAIIVVHTYGSPVAMKSLQALAHAHNLWIVEDAAEAHGAQFHGKAVGSLGDIAAFSLYANKLITTGEGGMITTNNQKIAKRINTLRNHAFSHNRHFWHEFVGFGYRMTNLQAAVGLGQTERFSSLLSAKRTHAAQYTSLLSRIPGITTPHESPGTVHSYWMYGIRIDPKQFGMNRNDLRKYLARHGVETRTFFVPIHFQPAYWQQFTPQRFVIAEQLGRDGLYLPSSTTLSKKNIAFICSIIEKAYHERAK